MIVLDLILDVLGNRARNKVAFSVVTIAVMAVAVLLYLGWNSGTLKL